MIILNIKREVRQLLFTMVKNITMVLLWDNNIIID